MNLVGPGPQWQQPWEVQTDHRGREQCWCILPAPHLSSWGGGLEVVEYSPSLPVWGSLTLRPEDEDPLPCPGTSSCARLQAGWECQSWGFGPGLLLAPCPSSPVRMFLLVYIFYWK